jgi:hypothetical protein
MVSEKGLRAGLARPRVLALFDVRPHYRGTSESVRGLTLVYFPLRGRSFGLIVNLTSPCFRAAARCECQVRGRWSREAESLGGQTGTPQMGRLRGKGPDLLALFEEI